MQKGIYTEIPTASCISQEDWMTTWLCFIIEVAIYFTNSRNILLDGFTSNFEYFFHECVSKDWFVKVILLLKLSDIDCEVGAILSRCVGTNMKPVLQSVWTEKKTMAYHQLSARLQGQTSAIIHNHTLSCFREVKELAILFANSIVSHYIKVVV